MVLPNLFPKEDGWENSGDKKILLAKYKIDLLRRVREVRKKGLFDPLMIPLATSLIIQNK
jgi:hypothetical protein